MKETGKTSSSFFVSIALVFLVVVRDYGMGSSKAWNDWFQALEPTVPGFGTDGANNRNVWCEALTRVMPVFGTKEAFY